MYSQFRFAARALVRWQGGAVAAVLMLAIGIGTATALSAVVRVLLADLPGVADMDRLARVYAAHSGLRVERSPVALREFDTNLSGASSFAAIGAYSDQDATIGTGDGVRPIIAGYATPGFFVAMGVPPAEGRVFNRADLDGASPVVVVSEALWRRQFGHGDLHGASIVVDGVERAVVGVMPRHFRYPFIGVNADLWIPLGRASQQTPAIVTVYGRLRDGVTWAAATAELAALSRDRAPWTWNAIPLRRDVTDRAINAYAGTLAPAFLVLLIACINVASLLLARGVAREQELTVRRALGATRGRIVRQLFVENLVLATVSGGLGIVLAAVMLRATGIALGNVDPALAGRLAGDTTLLPMALGISVVACVLFGTVPALRLSRRDLVASLHGRSSSGPVPIAGYGARDVIVFVEVASAAGLAVWTAMVFTLFAQIRSIAFTFPADHVVAMRVPGGEMASAAERVGAIPGVASVGVTAGMIGGRSPVRVTADGAGGAVMSRVPVGSGFFETLGVPIVRGRSFLDSELGGTDGVAVLSESAAARLAPGRDPLGMQVRLGGASPILVVGVSRDAIDYGALGRADAFAPPEIFLPYAPSVGEGVVLARVNGDAHAALRAIAAAAQTPAGSRQPRPVIIGDEMRDRERGSAGNMVIVRLLAMFTVLTLVLAASGVFAVISQSVAQRTREFGIRLAIGATPGALLRSVMAREARLIAAAIGTGLVFTMALTRVLFMELTSLSAIVPSMWIGALMAASIAAASAALLAIWRIVRLEPSVVLRRS